MSSNYSGVESNPNLSDLKVYRFVMFCVPILFTFMLLFLFYLLYLRPRRVNWSSLRMRTTASSSAIPSSRDQPQFFTEVGSGLRKEVRELLPIIIYKESFSVRDTQCSVCLGDYEAEDRLQQIPACGHTFHVNCIDHWLSNHTTCPLCRLSLLSSAKSPTPLPGSRPLAAQSPPIDPESSGEAPPLQTSQAAELMAGDVTAVQNSTAEESGEREVMECKGQRVDA